MKKIVFIAISCLVIVFALFSGGYSGRSVEFIKKAEAKIVVVACFQADFSRCHIDHQEFSPYRGVGVEIEEADVVAP